MWNRLIQTIAVCAGILLSPELVSAHPGHGQTSPDTLQHYVLEPVHALPVVVVIVGIVVGWLAHRGRKVR